MQPNQGFGQGLAKDLVKLGPRACQCISHDKSLWHGFCLVGRMRTELGTGTGQCWKLNQRTWTPHHQRNGNRAKQSNPKYQKSNTNQTSTIKKHLPPIRQKERVGAPAREARWGPRGTPLLSWRVRGCFEMDFLFFWSGGMIIFDLEWIWGLFWFLGIFKIVDSKIETFLFLESN